MKNKMILKCFVAIFFGFVISNAEARKKGTIVFYGGVLVCNMGDMGNINVFGSNPQDCIVTSGSVGGKCKCPSTARIGTIRTATKAQIQKFHDMSAEDQDIILRNKGELVK